MLLTALSAGTSCLNRPPRLHFAPAMPDPTNHADLSTNPLDSGESHGPLVFISAAEPSADAHGAALIRATRRIRPEIRFVGIAGPAMQAEGCWPIFDMTQHAAMLLGVVKAVPQALRLLKTTKEHLQEYDFSAAVVIDSPTLNLPIALRAKKAGLPVLYYIAPQLWAWGEFRTARVRKRVDRLAVILPFEQEFFRGHNIDATFVGHPLGDVLASQQPDAELTARIKSSGEPTIAILPGSRKHVAEEVFSGQLEVAAQIARQFKNAHFGVSVANDRVAGVIDDQMAGADLALTTYPREQNPSLLAAADLVLVASGTATLEVAFYGKPMIVMYNGSRLLYQLVGRWLLKTPHLSLVNILARKELVPEFMPYYTSTKPIADKAIDLLSSPESLASMSAELTDLITPLKKTGASEKTARMLLDMMD